MEVSRCCSTRPASFHIDRPFWRDHRDRTTVGLPTDAIEDCN
jgi:hypothetical protein